MADPSRHRDVTAKTVLRNPEILSGYPHRYLLVFQDNSMRHFGDLLAAIELLESQGWWAVQSITNDSTATRMYALMRRTR
jgi:hypothetical protein